MITTRRIVQLGFLALTIVGVFVVQGNAERWCPFGGVEALYTYATEGNLTCSLGVSNFFILGGVLAITLLLRRAFCGYMCPIGTISEWFGRAAARLGIKTGRIPHALDRVLAKLKYGVLAIILYYTYTTAELMFRGFDPCYALIGRHGEDVTLWTYVVSGAIIVGSLFVMMPFCRWLCPLAAVLNPFSRFALTRIKRDKEACIDCGECAARCPMGIKVDEVAQVTAARCMSCLDCIDVCPTSGEGALRWGPTGRPSRVWSKGVLVTILLLCTTTAVAASYLFPLPAFIKATGEDPAVTATVELNIQGVTCRGSSNRLVYYLTRDDLFDLGGYVKLEAWPAPEVAKTLITYDPTACNETDIKRAITEPYFDLVENVWRPSTFIIEGYDSLED